MVWIDELINSRDLKVGTLEGVLQKQGFPSFKWHSMEANLWNFPLRGQGRDFERTNCT
jgi:hypothetical protein